jgi:hypothetical protein
LASFEEGPRDATVSEVWTATWTPEISLAAERLVLALCERKIKER